MRQDTAVSAPDPAAAQAPGPADAAGTVCVRLWAAARAAAGVGELVVEVPGAVDLRTLTALVLAQRPDRGDLGRVLEVCSVLVGDRPAGAGERAAVLVPVGATVEFLPPFAGG